MARQIKPPARLIMKLTISGVTNSAAQIRSPSFSRSSSSATMTNLPARISRRAFSIEERDMKKGVRCQELGARARSQRPEARGQRLGLIRSEQLLDVLPYHVGFHVNFIVVAERVERGVAQCVVDQRKLN